jgi:hypothetical protein
MDSKNKKVLVAVTGAVALVVTYFLVKNFWCDKSKDQAEKRDN